MYKCTNVKYKRDIKSKYFGNRKPYQVDLNTAQGLLGSAEKALSPNPDENWKSAPAAPT